MCYMVSDTIKLNMRIQAANTQFRLTDSQWYLVVGLRIPLTATIRVSRVSASLCQC